jgi:hypothetical protein
VPAVPVNVQPVTVTTPDDAVRPPHDDNVPPEATKVIADENEVTT